MSIRAWRLAIVCLLAVLPSFAASAQSQQQQTTAAQRQVERSNAMELQAVIDGDAARAAGYFVDDAILLPPDGSVVRGRSAIQEYWTPTPGTRITEADTETLHFDVQGNQATLVGTYTLTTESTGQTTTFAGTFFMLWRRVGTDDWRIVVDSWTSREVPR